jgi:hypothetical protein
MNTQIFDQIALDVKTLEFTLYINVLGIQERLPITHSKAQHLIECVNVSNNYKIEIELACSNVYYIVERLNVKQG